MPFNLAINRYGFIGSTFESHADIQPTFLVKELRNQIKLITFHSSFKDIDHAIFEIARSRHPAASQIELMDPTDHAADVITVARDESTSPAKTSPLTFVALFPSSRLRCVVEGIAWTVRVRASLTASLPSSEASRPGLWWNFEGVPEAGAKAAVTESHATAFEQMTRQMYEAANPLLRQLYLDARSEITLSRHSPFAKYDQVCISLADVDSKPFAELLDALYRKHQKISDIQNLSTTAPARGLKELERFVHDIAHLKVSDRTTTLSDGIPGVEGVVCRSGPSPSQKHTVVAGFAHPRGLGLALGRPGKSEDYIRTMSGARKLSARLADLEAAKLHGQTPRLSL